MEKNFIKRLLDADDPLSLKRFVTIIVAGHFIIASFAALFITFYMIFYIPKGKVDTNLLNLLKDILYYDLLIIGGGLGFITVDNFGQAMIAKAKIAIGSSNDSENTNDNKEPSIKDEPK